MDNLPKVSIVIPVYNGSNFLREAIDSALNQTYQNLEVLVINDGSNDDGKTESIALSFGNKIRYFSKENGGVASALNFGIRQMTGEWFAWLSHDDLFSKNRIEEDINIINNNLDAKIIFCKTAVIDENGKLINEVSYPINKVTNPREALLLSGVDMCAMTIHKSCFDEIGFFDEKNRTTQDTQMSLLLSSRFHYYLNNKSTSYRREHKERGIHVFSQQHKKDVLYLCDFIHNRLSIDDFFPELKDNPNNISDAWLWMGFFYNNFGALNHAEECFYKSVHYERNIFKKNVMILKIFIFKYKSKISELM